MASDSIFCFDICSIHTIVEKHERLLFDFHTVCREWDGFVLFTKGNAILRSSGKEDTLLNEGDIVFLRKGSEYGFFSAEGCSYITSGFYFSSCEPDLLPLSLTVWHCNNGMCERIKELARLWERRLFDGYMECKIELLSLYLEFVRLNTSKSRTKDRAVALAIEFIHNNFKRNFTSEEISRYCSISSSYLRSRFLREVGMSITDYRDKLRLNAAKELLTAGVFTVKETADELGFCDVYHFSKFFSKACGMPPARYSKESKTTIKIS